jgi:hypothetical protein
LSTCYIAGLTVPAVVKLHPNRLGHWLGVLVLGYVFATIRVPAGAAGNTHSVVHCLLLLLLHKEFQPLQTERTATPRKPQHQAAAMITTTPG